MHDCNRHRDNGLKDVTWKHRVQDDVIEAFQKYREADRDRKQNLVNHIFPQLAEARDQYIKQE